MTRFVSIGCKYYDLSSGSLSTEPIGEIVTKDANFKVYTAECLLMDLEELNGVPAVVWPASKKSEGYYKPYPDWLPEALE